MNENYFRTLYIQKHNNLRVNCKNNLPQYLYFSRTEYKIYKKYNDSIRFLLFVLKKLGDCFKIENHFACYS